MLIRNNLKKISKEKIIALLFTPILLLNAAQSHAERINILQDTWHFSVFNLNVLEHLQPGQNIPHSNSFEIDFPVFYFEEGMASYLGSMLTASFSAESLRTDSHPSPAQVVTSPCMENWVFQRRQMIQRLFQFIHPELIPGLKAKNLIAA